VRFRVRTVKEGVIEIQGDHCEQVIENLKKQGGSLSGQEGNWPATMSRDYAFVS